MKKTIFLLCACLILFSACSKPIEPAKTTSDVLPSLVEKPLAQESPLEKKVIDSAADAQKKLESLLGQRAILDTTFKEGQIGDTLVFGYAIRNQFNYLTNFSTSISFASYLPLSGVSFDANKEVIDAWIDKSSFQTFELKEKEVRIVPIIFHIGDKVNDQTDTEFTTYTFNLVLKANQRDSGLKEYDRQEIHVKVT